MSNSIGVVSLSTVPRTIEGCHNLRCSQRFSLMQQLNAFASHEDKLAFSSKPNDQPARLLAALQQYDANGGEGAQPAPQQPMQQPAVQQPQMNAPPGAPMPGVTAAPQMPGQMPGQLPGAPPPMAAVPPQMMAQPQMAAPPMAVATPQQPPPTIGLPGAPSMAQPPQMPAAAPQVPDGREPAMAKATAAVAGKGKGKRGKKAEEVSGDALSTILSNQQKLAASLEALAQGNEGLVVAIEALGTQVAGNAQLISVLMTINVWLAEQLRHAPGQRLNLAQSEWAPILTDGSLNQILQLLGGQPGK